MNLTIAELARAVEKSETYVRQHIHRKHLIAQKDGRSVYVDHAEAVRWARERELPVDALTRASVTTGARRGRIARMTVLVWDDVAAKPRNLFTLIRHRRADALGPWASEPDESWSCDDLGDRLRLFSCDAPFERCEALIDQILDSGELKIDGIEIAYALNLTPRRHWAYRDERPLAEASLRSPFLKHSAEVVEYWSFAEGLRNSWREMLESHPTNSSLRLSRLGFPLERRPDRVGNLMIAGAEDAITCDLGAGHDRTLRLHVDSDELLSEAYRATVWASHSGDEVVRREILLTSQYHVLNLESEVDHIGFAIFRAADGQCIDLMEAFLLMEISVKLMVDSGPTLHLHNRRKRLIHSVKPAGAISRVNVHSDNENAEVDKEIRQRWLDRRLWEREVDTRREGNFRRFQPTEVVDAFRYFIDILCQDSDQKAANYLVDPYFPCFEGQLKGNEKLYKLCLDLFASTTGAPLLILCQRQGQEEGNPTLWWSDHPREITAHVKVRSIRKNPGRTTGVHDRYLITPKQEILITHSINGWDADGVTFVRLPYDVYRADAERLWSMESGSENTEFFIEEVT